MKYFPKGLINKYFNVCPGSGKITSLKSNKTSLLYFPAIGVLAILWFLIRTIPKPSRAVYPCQRAAAGIGGSFLAYLAGMAGSFFYLNRIKRHSRYLTTKTAICIILLCVFSGLFTSTVFTSFITENNTIFADWNPSDSPNSPVGTAKGIHPGRVTWAHNPDATADNVSGYFWQPGNTNQNTVNKMVADSVMSLAGTADNASAWDAIFKHFNQAHGKGNTGYVSGETIAIKINTVNTNGQTKTNGNIDATAETILAVVDNIVTQAGVPAGNIIVYDGGVGTIGSYVYNCVAAVYPNIRFEAAQTWGSIQAIGWVSNGITYSGVGTTTSASRMVARCIWDADYAINLALLKKHEDQTAITLCGKNHFGTIQNCRDIHSTINDHINGMGSYNSLVDLLGHERIGGKTLLFIIDGLWGAPRISGQPTRWSLSPFNGDWPSSIFMSQDGVAIDSVGLDFLNAEWSLWDNADNYLHEAARADNPPSGTYYDPENDGSRLFSLGAHEHWNNARDKKYSRNLGTGNGIELVTAGSVTPDGKKGDVNSDDSVNIIDALLVAQYYVGLIPDNFNISNADTNCDNNVNIVDALLVAQYYVGLITSFC